MHDDYRVALYYCYIEIDDTEKHVKVQKDVCKELNLKGRIRVSPEGLNGVLSGLLVDLKVYQEEVEAELHLEIDVKYCLLRMDLPVEPQLFDSLSVKITREVVSLYEPKEEVAVSSKTQYRRKRRNRLRQEQEPDPPSVPHPDIPTSPQDERLAQLTPAQHLTPQEWHERLLHQQDDNIILVDARNAYESNVGYFAAPGATTLLTNTRKYSNLPQVLRENQQALAGKDVFMYCTGGVRCERASVFLQALGGNGDEERPKNIYQLGGGIQRYLEQYGLTDRSTNSGCLFQGKNFCFDQRRTDPMTGGSKTVGKCRVCDITHDDYDNQKAPCDGNEVRCFQCRVLVLVCDPCRSKVRAWGQDDDDDDKPDLYCGKSACLGDGVNVSIFTS